MSSSLTTVRRKLAVGAMALAAAVAVPLQAGTAHAATPEEDLTACIDATVQAGVGDVTAAINDCVNAYLAELGVDPSVAATVDSASSPDTGDVATGILSTIDSSDAAAA